MAKTFSAPPFRRGKTSRAPPSRFVAPPLPVISDHSLNGQQYMVVVDYYSRYIELVYLADTITHTVTAKLKCIFARFGIPDLLVSDNGPQFSSKEFRQFADLLGFTHQTSSPYYPQANGQSERAVQVAKTILRQSDVYS